MFWGSMSIGTTSGLKNLNNLAGGLASSAVSFAFTGNATFNILNLTDFGTRIYYKYCFGVNDYGY